VGIREFITEYEKDNGFKLLPFQVAAIITLSEGGAVLWPLRAGKTTALKVLNAWKITNNKRPGGPAVGEDIMYQLWAEGDWDICGVSYKQHNANNRGDE